MDSMSLKLGICLKKEKRSKLVPPPSSTLTLFYRLLNLSLGEEGKMGMKMAHMALALLKWDGCNLLSLCGSASQLSPWILPDAKRKAWRVQRN